MAAVYCHCEELALSDVAITVDGKNCCRRNGSSPALGEILNPIRLR